MKKEKKRCRCAMNDLLLLERKSMLLYSFVFLLLAQKNRFIIVLVISMINGEEIVTYHIQFSNPARLLGTG
jgi:hypothetical protein